MQQQKPQRAYVIRPEDRRQNWRMAKLAAEGLRNVVNSLTDESAPVEVVIREWSPPRTDPQRKTMWLWHGEVASELSLRTGKRWTKDDVHEVVFIARFMPLHEEELIDFETGAVLPPRRKRTSEATKKENSDAMTAYLAWIYEMGISVTVPEGGW